MWWKREPLVAGALGLGVLGVLFWVTQWGEASDLKHFFSPIGPVLALGGALGAADLAKRMKRNTWVLPALAGVLLCGGLLTANWKEYNFSQRWGNRDRWAAALLQMAPHAVFVSDLDQPNFITEYLQNVERLRPDIVLLRATQLGDPQVPRHDCDPEVRTAVGGDRIPGRASPAQDVVQ